MSLDKLRGLAVVVMILGHWGRAAGVPGIWWADVTLGRVALPLFALVAGFLLRNRDGTSLGRTCELWTAAIAATLLVPFLPGMAPLDVLAVFAIALVFWPAGRRWPATTVVVCLVVSSTFPIGGLGFHPAHVLALMVCGPMLLGEGSKLRAWGDALPSWMAAAGRMPLSLYVGHLAVLVLWYGEMPEWWW